MRPNRFLLSFTLFFAIFCFCFQLVKGATLEGSLALVPDGSNINLTAEGTADWAHWGLNGPGSFNHKQGAVSQVGNFTVIGTNSVAQYFAKAHNYTWTNGTPTPTSTNNTGVLIRGLMNGFELTLPADTALRRANVYVGVNAAEGRFEATLSDASDPDYVDASLVHDTQRLDGVYALSYAAASAGQFLTIRFTVTHLFSDSGYVSWKAVALASNAPPIVRITSPTNNTVFSTFSDVTIVAEASDVDGTISTVEFFQGTTNLGVAFESPYTLTWPNAVPGNYTLTARATDNEGATAVSAPVQIRVSTNRPPIVTIISPTNDAAFLVPANITVEATAMDPEGPVTKVEFFAGRNRLTEITNAPYRFVWNDVPLGNHLLTARATDTNGLTKVSSPVSIFVTTAQGSIAGSVATPPASIDLTSEGIADWAHWGLVTESSFDHKEGVESQISTYELIGEEPAYPYADNPHGYSWTDGTPIPAVTNTITGVYVVGLKNGFEIHVAAATVVRTLKLYVGTYGARGKLQAFLSDFSSPPFSDSSIDNLGNGPSGVYTIDFAATTPDQNLILRYTVSAMHDPVGNVTLQAATLVTENNPPRAGVTNPVDQAQYIFPANVRIDASAADSDGAISKVEFLGDGTSLGQRAAVPYSLTWSNVPIGSHTVAVKATDNEGATFTSRPVNIFVGIGGGYLSGQVATTPSAVDLTEEGKSDWTHWGLITKSTFDHKRGVLPQVSNFRAIESHTVKRYDNNLAGFSWTNGTPNPSAIDTHTGVYLSGLGSGFEIEVPADPMPRRLNVYVGLYGARGHFEASLSDLSAPPFADASLESAFNDRVGVYSLKYSAARSGEKLVVRYTASVLYDPIYGNVTLQATTLQGAPSVPILAPLWNGMDFTFSFLTDVGWSYAVEYTDSLSPIWWQVLQTVPGNGTEVQILDSRPPGSQRLYRVRVY
jgi:hypothetical protein